MDSGSMSLQQLQVICLSFPSPLSLDFLTLCPFSLLTFFLHLDLLFFFFFKNTSFVPLLLHLYLFLVLLPSLHLPTPPSPCCPSPCSRVLALVVVKAALPLKTVCLNEKGGVGRGEGAEGHSWTQLHPFPVWGAAGRGQAQGHAGPSLRLSPGAGSELPPACVYKTVCVCVFLSKLRKEGQEAHLFLIPQKEERASERSHAHSMCRVWSGTMWRVFAATSSSTSFSSCLPITFTFSGCIQVLEKKNMR